jgi:hypothetical protein
MEAMMDEWPKDYCLLLLDGLQVPDVEGCAALDLLSSTKKALP